ncbi:heme/steroid binding protein [Penicillium chermesinum]|uniref:Heme/steroid binding protein n=1 Tax=Penicillium chermesinum TaxID=63820 RepID=A0A9W9TTZ6_9EURO|nr:heme/steroid binding protein [Penicillium chermesinum]KAJ5239454.1 heme/steroid binding protein [Penicillium chermesinum]
MDLLSRYLPWPSNRSTSGTDPSSEPTDPAPEPSAPQSPEQSRPTPSSVPAPPTLIAPTISLDNETDNQKEPPAPTESPAPQNSNQISQKSTATGNHGPSQPETSKPTVPQSITPQPAPTPSANPSSLMPPPAAPVPRVRQTPLPNRTPGGLQPPRVGDSPRAPLSAAGAARLNWAAFASNPKNKLRGEDVPSEFIRVTPSMLKAHNGRKGRDAWTSYQGKVYNISPYLPYHPGGKGEILRGAGKDSGKLFQEVHPWVNWDGILNECLIGILVSEDTPTENRLDAMD